MKKQLSAALMAFALALVLLPLRVMAAPKIIEEFFPSGEITAPQAPFLQYDGKKDDGDSITMWYVVPKDVLALAGAYNRWGDANDGRDGFAARFGLYYTDYGKMELIPKKSAGWYRNVIRNGGFEE